MFTQEDIEMYINTYAIPWGINIAMALIIFVIGRMVVGIIISMFGKLMSKSKYDDMLVDFLKSILNPRDISITVVTGPMISFSYAMVCFSGMVFCTVAILRRRAPGRAP